MPGAWVYILQCGDGSFYTGNTSDLVSRLWQHQIGEGSSYTKGRLPIQLVYCQYLSTKQAAYLAEQQIKGWSRAKKIALINDDWELISNLSRKINFKSKNQAP